MGFILTTIGWLTLVVIGVSGLYFLFSALRGRSRGKSFLGFTLLITAIALWAYGSWNDGSVLEGSFLLGVIATLAAIFIIVQFTVPFNSTAKSPRAKKVSTPPAQPSEPAAKEEIFRP